jgi:intracellular sulfur oxidation DsrE/DsrF family protein
MRYLIMLICIGSFLMTSAQPSDTLTKGQKDSIRIAGLFSKASYPLIKTSKYSGVLPVSHVTEKPDASMEYKLLMEDVIGIKDSTAAREISDGLSEIGRIINLHIASGIPKNKLQVVAVVHGSALYALYTNEVYKKKYGVDNPNIVLINELMKNGVKFIACGQAMNFFEVRQEEMVPNIKISLTAQTVLSNYQLKGFVLYAITPN